MITIGYLQGHPINIDAIKGSLSDLKHWFNTGDKEVVIPTALILGVSIAGLAGWVLL